MKLVSIMLFQSTTNWYRDGVLLFCITILQYVWNVEDLFNSQNFMWKRHLYKNKGDSSGAGWKTRRQRWRLIIDFSFIEEEKIKEREEYKRTLFLWMNEWWILGMMMAEKANANITIKIFLSKHISTSIAKNSSFLDLVSWSVCIIFYSQKIL